VRKLLMLATCALVSSLFLAPAVGAQEMMEDTMMMDDSMMMEEKMDDSMMMDEKMEQPKMEKGKMMEEPKMEKGKMMEMPKTGGLVAPSTLILPAAAVLLLGSGLLAYGIQRRRS
jgi:hypothetical protein